MRYKLGLAPMTSGPGGGWGAGRDESKAVFDAFARAGGNRVDTANRFTLAIACDVGADHRKTVV